MLGTLDQNHRSAHLKMPADEAIRFCLTRLDEDTEHVITDEVAAGLSYEQLIGTLLSALTGLQTLKDAEFWIPKRFHKTKGTNA